MSKISYSGDRAYRELLQDMKTQVVKMPNLQSLLEKLLGATIF